MEEIILWYVACVIPGYRNIVLDIKPYEHEDIQTRNLKNSGFYPIVLGNIHAVTAVKYN